MNGTTNDVGCLLSELYNFGDKVFFFVFDIEEKMSDEVWQFTQ